MLVSLQVPGAANADGRDVVSGPTFVTGVYVDGADTTINTLARPVVAPEGKSPANFLQWSNAAGAAGPVYDPANPAGRFKFGINLAIGERLRLEWQGAGVGLPLVSIIVEHYPELYRNVPESEKSRRRAARK